MSIHTSLGRGSSMQRHRSVIKRHEKVQTLEGKGKWDETHGVLGLPKVKIIKIKARKEKPKAVEGAAGTPVAAGAKPTPGATAGAKPAAAKPAEKKK